MRPEKLASSRTWRGLYPAVGSKGELWKVSVMRRTGYLAIVKGPVRFKEKNIRYRETKQGAPAMLHL